MVVKRRTKINRAATRKRTSARARRIPTRRRISAKQRVIKRRTISRVKKPVRRVRVGRVSHFFTNINVAVVEVERRLRHGDKVHVEGANTNFKQLVRSMQIERAPIKQALAGTSIGLKVNHRARPGNIVYKLLG